MLLEVGGCGVLTQKILVMLFMFAISHLSFFFFFYIIPQQSVPWHNKQHIIPSLSKYIFIKIENN